MAIDTSNISPRPWTVEETPNGSYLRDANGMKCAILLGLPERRQATAKFLAEVVNGRWLQLVSARSNPAETYSPSEADDGDDHQSHR